MTEFRDYLEGLVFNAAGGSMPVYEQIARINYLVGLYESVHAGRETAPETPPPSDLGELRSEVGTVLRQLALTIHRADALPPADYSEKPTAADWRGRAEWLANVLTKTLARLEDEHLAHLRLAALRVGTPPADTTDLLDRLVAIMNTLHKGDGPHCNCGVKETIILIRDWQDRLRHWQDRLPAGVPLPAAETPTCANCGTIDGIIGRQVDKQGETFIRCPHHHSAAVPPPADETWQPEGDDRTHMSALPSAPAKDAP